MRNIIVILFGIFVFAFLLSHETNYKQIHQSESPEGMADYRAMMRGGEFQPYKINQAREAVLAALEKNGKHHNLKDGGIGSWEELGPKNYSGRIKTIAPHPTNGNVIFLGAESGGIWKTTNGGSSWSPIGDFLPTLSVSSIIIHPSHPDTMYASTGVGITTNTNSRSTPGAGIFRTYDGGNHWEVIPAITESNQSDFYYVNKIEFDPVDPTVFYAGTTAKDPNGSFTTFGCAVQPGKAFKFSDNGVIVQELVKRCEGGITDIDFSGSGTSIYFGEQEGLIKYDLLTGISTLQNGLGAFPSNPGRVQVAVSSSNTSVIYALCEGDAINFGQLIKSTNGGLTWTNMSLSVEPFKTGNNKNQGWFDNTIWVDPTDEDNLVIGGINLYRSLDGGISFTQISNSAFYYNGDSPHGDQHYIVQTQNFSAATPRILVANDGGIAGTANYKTASETSGWALLNNNSLGTSQNYDGHVQGDKIIVGAQDNGTNYSDDSGITWSHIGPNDGGNCMISAQDDRVKYYSSQFGKIYTQTSTGTQYDLLDLKTIDSASFIAPMAIYPNDGYRILIGGWRLWRVKRNNILNVPVVLEELTDIGPPQVIARMITTIEIAPDSSLIYLGYNNGDLYKGVHSGDWNWTKMSYGIQTKPITSITINPNNMDKVAFSIGGYFPNRVYLTTDGGSSWTPKSNGLPDIHVNDLVWHPNLLNRIYCASELGVYASEDNGNNWNITPNLGGIHDGPVFTEVSKLQFGSKTQGGRKLYAITFGRGVWQTESNVVGNIYVDEDATSIDEWGTAARPYKTIQQAEDIQAHGQTWHVDGGVYSIPDGEKVVIKKRIGKLNQTGTGSVVIKGSH